MQCNEHFVTFQNKTPTLLTVFSFAPDAVAALPDLPHHGHSTSWLSRSNYVKTNVLHYCFYILSFENSNFTVSNRGFRLDLQ